MTSESAALHEMMAQANRTTPLVVRVAGKDITFNYKKLGWLGKNRCISIAMEYYAEGAEVKGRLHLDRYKAAALGQMLVDPPWPITTQVLEALDDEAGAAFDSIIPDPFDTGSKRVSASGKELEGSSEETLTPAPETPSSSEGS